MYFFTPKSWKALLKKEKTLAANIFTFSHNFFRSTVDHVRLSERLNTGI